MFMKIKGIVFVMLMLPNFILAQSYTMLGNCAVQYMKKGYNNEEVIVTNLQTVDSMKIIKGAMALYRNTDVEVINLRTTDEAKSLMGSFATCVNNGKKVSLSL